MTERVTAADVLARLVEGYQRIGVPFTVTAWDRAWATLYAEYLSGTPEGHERDTLSATV